MQPYNTAQNFRGDYMKTSEGEVHHPDSPRSREKGESNQIYLIQSKF